MSLMNYKQRVLAIENKSKNPYYFYNKQHAMDEKRFEELNKRLLELEKRIDIIEKKLGIDIDNVPW